MPLPGALVAGKRPIVLGAGGLAPTSAGPAPTGGSNYVPPGSDSLAFSMQPQIADNWCWSATATSVSIYYNKSSIWTQCSLANGMLSLPSGVDCCLDPDDTNCDIPWYLDRALQKTGNLLDVRSGPIGFSDVKGLIDAKEPLGSRVGWSGGGGHFVVLFGWKKTTSGDEFLEIADPIYGTSTVPYNDFVARYRAVGSWTHSYWTKA